MERESAPQPEATTTSGRIVPGILASVEATGTLLVSFVATIVFSAPVLLVWGLRGGAGSWRSGAALLQVLPWLLGLQAVVLIGMGVLLVKLRVRRASATGPRNVPLALLLGMGGALAAFAISWVIGLLLYWIGMPIEEQAWILELASDPHRLLLLAPLLAILAPVSEEVFFRAYMFRFLEQRGGPALGYSVSSLLFAAVHWNPAGIPVYVAIGLVLAYVYRRSSSLLAPITAHICFNLLVLSTYLARAGLQA